MARNQAVKFLVLSRHPVRSFTHMPDLVLLHEIPQGRTQAHLIDLECWKLQLELPFHVRRGESVAGDRFYSFADCVRHSTISRSLFRYCSQRSVDGVKQLAMFEQLTKMEAQRDEIRDEFGSVRIRLREMTDARGAFADGHAEMKKQRDTAIAERDETAQELENARGHLELQYRKTLSAENSLSTALRELAEARGDAKAMNAAYVALKGLDLSFERAQSDESQTRIDKAIELLEGSALSREA